MSEEFGSLDLDGLQLESERLANKGGANRFDDQFVPSVEVAPGKSHTMYLRLLPPSKGAKLFQYNRTHMLNDRSIHCPRPLLQNGTWDRKVPCPICDYYSLLWKQIEALEKQYGKDCPQCKTLKEEARGMKPNERYYYNVIIRELGDKKNVGPRIWSVGKLLHNKVIRALVGDKDNPRAKIGNVTDIKSGFDFVWVKENDGGFPKYDKSEFDRERSILGTPEEIAKWAGELHDLTKFRNPRDLDYLEQQLAIHRGLIADDSDGMDIEAFDAKYKKDKKEEVREIVNHTAARATVAADVVKEAPKVEETPVAVVAAEDVAVEDEDFLKELEEFDGK